MMKVFKMTKLMSVLKGYFFAIVVILIAFAYIANSQTVIAELRDSKYELEIKLEDRNKEIAVLAEQNRNYVANIKALDQSYKDARDARNELQDKLNKHDLEKLARLKPGLVTKAMNNGTTKVFQDVNNAYKRLIDNEYGEEEYQYEIESEF